MFVCSKIFFFSQNFNKFEDGIYNRVDYILVFNLCWMLFSELCFIKDIFAIVESVLKAVDLDMYY